MRLILAIFILVLVTLGLSSVFDLGLLTDTQAVVLGMVTGVMSYATAHFIVEMCE